jgi:precorrin-6B methylase 2
MNTAIIAAPETETSSVGSPKSELEESYVPTHESIVDAMLLMAAVKADDVLYDLGTGDGRIPVTAAKRFGTRGVGIDPDPVRVQEAKANAAKEGVNDKVMFKEGDIFDEDLSEATVITLHPLPEVDFKLKRRIQAMKPGTRIVSHNYDMGDWKPERTRVIKTPDDVDHYVYLWRVPEKKK